MCRGGRPLRGGWSHTLTFHPQVRLAWGMGQAPGLSPHFLQRQPRGTSLSRAEGGYRESQCWAGDRRKTAFSILQKRLTTHPEPGGGQRGERGGPGKKGKALTERSSSLESTQPQSTLGGGLISALGRQGSQPRIMSQRAQGQGQVESPVAVGSPSGLLGWQEPRSTQIPTDSSVAQRQMPGRRW